MIKRILLFLVLNFGALAIGGLFTGSGATSDWYQHLNKAPWTPPGWVFGAAWFSIMFCFAIYMAYLVKSKADQKKIIILFSLQWVLNISWNPIFFYYHAALTGLICISLLTLLIAYMLFYYWKVLKIKTLWLAPYLLWLLVATSLNSYILFFN